MKDKKMVLIPFKSGHFLDKSTQAFLQETAVLIPFKSGHFLDQLQRHDLEAQDLGLNPF